MKELLKVLILEDRHSDVQLMLAELRLAGFRPDWTWVDNELDFRRQLASNPQVILSDFSLPSFDALQALKLTREQGCDAPFIVVSGSIGEDDAVNAMKQGAADYLLKDRLGRLGAAVQNAVEQFRLRREARRAEEARRNAEALFSKLVDNSLVGIQILQEGRFIFANPKVCEIYGYAAEELLSLDSWQAVVMPSDRATVAEQISKRLSGETPEAHYFFRGCRKDQREIEIEIRSTLIEAGGQPAILGMLVDITDRRRAEAEIQRSTDLLRAIAEWTPDVIFVKDLEGRYLFFNPAAEQFTRRDESEIIGRDDSALFAPELVERIRAVDRRVMASGRLETTEEELTSGGNTLHFLTTKAPYRDRSGAIAGLLGISRDITARKQAEAERLHLLTRLQLQFDRLPLGCLLTNAEFAITDWNAAAQEIFGFSRTEVLGLCPPYSVFTPPQAWPSEELLRRIRAGDMGVHSVHENLTQSGRLIICEWNYTPLFDADGRFVGMAAIAQDVTGRRDAERALKLRDRAIQAVSQGILITDPALPDNPIIYASPAFEELTGYSTEDVVGQNCRFLQGPKSDPETVAQVRRAIRSGEPCKVEILNYRKDGSTFWNELTISPVRDDRGRLTHFVGSQADVSSRRLLEEQFRQAQKMEAVGRLAGGVAHDFNNLLTIINGYSELILDGLPPGNPVTGYVVQIQKAGQRAAALTRQLLAFSRKQVLQPVELNLNLLIRDMEIMLERLIGEDVALRLDLKPDLSRVFADRGQMEQVILNLIINARDAMPMGGNLTVRTRNLFLDAGFVATHTEARTGPHVLLEVCDTGCGMDKATLARIFEPFFTTKDADRGTGLGLATVYGIVKQSNGEIDVISEPGQGSTFQVYLPAHGLSETATQGTVDPMPSLRGNETILLVEDEGAVRTLAAQLLRSAGYTVLEAASSEQALDLARQNRHSIRLVVTDVVMPVMGGREMVESVRAFLPDVRVLYMSGYTEDLIVRHGVSQSEGEFLQKPFPASLLRSKVRRLLDLVAD